MDRNPGQLLDDIEASRSQLTTHGQSYAMARHRYSKAILAYEKALGKQYLKMIADSEKSGKRPPAEDMRKAIAHSKIDDSVWEEYLLAHADLDVADRLIKVEQANLSGLQSELQQLRVEWTHA